MISKWDQLLNWTAVRNERLAQLETFAKENQQTLRMVGIITLAGATGTVIGLLLGKGLIVVNGAAAVKGAAAVNGVAAAKGAAATAVAPATTTATIQGAVNLLNNTALTGASLVDKVAALFQTLTTNALPITAGAVGGSAVGVGVTRSQVRQVQTQLDEQMAQKVAAEVETAQIQQILKRKEAHLAELQTKLATVTPSPDDLEAIRGIGQVMAQRLNAAGIYTFAALAAQTPQQLRTIIGTGRSTAMMNPEAWITEAQQRVAGSSATTTTAPQSLPPDLPPSAP